MTPTLAAPTPPKTQLAFGPQGVQLSTLEDAYRFATAIVKSGFAPKGMESPEAVMIALQMGAEVGLTPMAALQNTAVINGRPALYGDAALAVVRASNVFESYKEDEIGERGKDTWGFRVTSKRQGSEVMSEEFTVADAKQAKLWGKQGPWSDYPKRMLKFRARGFNLRDNFGDVLKGLRTVEEVRDFADEPRNVTPPRGLVEALDAPKAPPPSPEPDPDFNVAPLVDETESNGSISKAERGPPEPKKEEPKFFNRANVIIGIETHMLALGVPESKVQKYAKNRWPEESALVESFMDLRTDILFKIKDAIPELAKQSSQ